MKKYGRILVLITALVLLISVVPGMGFAATPDGGNGKHISESTAQAVLDEIENLAEPAGILNSWKMAYTGNTGAVEGVTINNNGGFSAGCALESKVVPEKTSSALKFSFTGSGFDVISAVGNTGMLYVVLKQNGTVKHTYLCDTFYNGGSGINDYGIVVMSDKELEYGTYDAEVYGVCASEGQTKDEIVAMASEDTDTVCKNIKCFVQDTGSILVGGKGVDTPEGVNIDAVRIYE